MEKTIQQKLTVGSDLPSDVLAQIREAAKHPVNFTKDSPRLTDEQLAEFRPVNFSSMEERRLAMIEAGVFNDEDDDEDEEEPVAVFAGK